MPDQSEGSSIVASKRTNGYGLDHWRAGRVVTASSAPSSRATSARCASPGATYAGRILPRAWLISAFGVTSAAAFSNSAKPRSSLQTTTSGIKHFGNVRSRPWRLFCGRCNSGSIPARSSAKCRGAFTCGWAGLPSQQIPQSTERLVGAEGFEPPTLCSQNRSDRLLKPVEIE